MYVTPLRMMSDGSLCLYQPGDKICVQQLDGTNKIYDVLAVVDIPKALETPLQVDMGLDIFSRQMSCWEIWYPPTSRP